MVSDPSGKGNNDRAAAKTKPGIGCHIFAARTVECPLMMRPLEPDELLSRCDLAGEAKVLTVGPNPVGPGIFARLEFTRIVKGRIETFQTELSGIAIVESGRRQSLVNERKRSPPIIGGGGPVCYDAGTFVFTHLNWVPEKGVYVSSWWNAVSVLQEPAK